MDNGTSPEPNETDADGAPPVDQASDEVAHEASGSDDAVANDERVHQASGDGEVANDERAADGHATDDAPAMAASHESAASDEPAGFADEPVADETVADETVADETVADEPALEAAPVDDDPVDDSPAVNDQALAPAPAPVSLPDKKWYVVHTYSGHENKAKLTLLERVKTHNLTDYFGEVLVPTETITENVKGGGKRHRNQKFFPGYMFVQMILDDRTFHLVKNTPKITGFLGGMKPTPVPPDQIKGVQSNMTEGPRGKAKARVSFEAGEQVRVVDGPFANFSAKVEEVKADKQKLKVSLSMFGRTTSVELDFAQVEKA